MKAVEERDTHVPEWSLTAGAAEAMDAEAMDVEADQLSLRPEQWRRRQRHPRRSGVGGETASSRRARLAILGQQLAGVAHESRSLLQRASSSLEMLEVELNDQPRVHVELERTRQAVMGLRRLLEELQSFAAPLVLEREHCSIAEIWREAWTWVAAENRLEGCELIEHPGALAACCYADRFRLAQLFRNLFENSLAASRGALKIEIDGHERRRWPRRDTREVWRRQAVVELTIRDNGSGVAHEQRRRIFEPFVTTKPRGTGLGLAIARRIAETHGGQLVLGPPQPIGTAMRLTLPATHRPA